METILENKQTNKGHGNSWKYYNDLEGFCIYFYRRLRETDPKAYNVKTNKEVIEFYQNSPSHLEFITSQWHTRRAITSKEQSRKGTICFERESGIWAMSLAAKKEAERSGGRNAIKKRKEDPIKYVESLKPWQSAGGKKNGPIQGRKNVDSGHWQECAELGAEATRQKWIEENQRRYDILLPLITDDWFTRKFMIDWFMNSKYATDWNLESGQFFSNMLDNEDLFLTSGNGRNKRYIKKTSDKINQPGDPISRLIFLVERRFEDQPFTLPEVMEIQSEFNDISDFRQWCRRMLNNHFTKIGKTGKGPGGGPSIYKIAAK